jgi:L-lactate dehydrogenase complex protein LldF
MSEFSQFIKLSSEKAEDNFHRAKITKAVTTHDQKVETMKQAQFTDWQQARNQAAAVKDFALDNLPGLLELFERNITQHGTRVLWAHDKAEAQKHILQIAHEHNAKKIIKAKSMTTEEVEFNEVCEQSGYEVLESDLGELIVQLAGEKPYHIVTPAMHKNTAEIAQLFHDKLDAPLTDSAEELTMVARKHLREGYVTADIGISGANFLLADTGAVVMTENEGNGRLTMACPPVHIVIAGIEKILPRITDLGLFLPLLSTSGTGQQITCYNSIIHGPKTSTEPDGPEHMYVILLDNGRSNMFHEDKLRESLRCIRCGACLNACPVYQTVGGHTYHTPYQGPIGSVITPQLRGLQQWHHLPYASSLCAACTFVCPVKIPLHELLLENRAQVTKAHAGSSLWKPALKIWSIIFSSRRFLTASVRIGGWSLPILKFLLPKLKRKRVPPLPKKTFEQLWKDGLINN